MQLFYAPAIAETSYVLDANQSKHCVQVLRKKVGDRITLIDGQGGFYQAQITKADKKACQFQIIDRQYPYRPLPFQLHIGIAPTKNIQRFEWFLEKTVEIGVTAITPLICHYSERKRLRFDRLEKILVASMKQSNQAFLPQLNDWQPFGDFIVNNTLQTNFQQRYIAYIDPQQQSQNLAKVYAGGDALVLIGPEGGFHPKEVELCLQEAYQTISLGQNRLRTETAGVAACFAFHLLNGKGIALL